MPEVGNDNISAYADDPRGYMNNRDVTRAEREKQWIVALASTNQLDPSKVKKSLKGKKKLKRRMSREKKTAMMKRKKNHGNPMCSPRRN